MHLGLDWDGPFVAVVNTSGPPIFCYLVPGAHSQGVKYISPKGFHDFSHPCMCSVLLYAAVHTVSSFLLYCNDSEI